MTIGKLRGNLILSLLLALMVASGCSSLTSDRQLRETQFTRYLEQPERFIFYYPSQLQLDDQLKVLGTASVGEPLQRQFNSISETRGMIKRFIASVPELAIGARIVDPDQWETLSLTPDTPVLFFHVTWKMSYQRLPPQFSKNRLQTGVIAKIIPAAQVTSHKGTIALRNAAWEGRCLYDAFQGNYYLIDEWLADDNARLREAIETTQGFCAEKLAQQFVLTIGSI